MPGALTHPLLLARHGQTADNAGGLILGRRDPPLSELGRAQALVLAAAALEIGVAAVWTSPLQRRRRDGGDRVGGDRSAGVGAR